MVVSRLSSYLNGQAVASRAGFVQHTVLGVREATLEAIDLVIAGGFGHCHGIYPAAVLV